RMNINRAPILMIRTKIRRRNIHAARLARPNPASISTVRLELPTTTSRGIVLLKQRDLLSLRTASRPNTKVRASISDRTIQRPRQSLVSAAFKPLDFILVRPRCGKLRRCHKGLLSGIEKAPPRAGRLAESRGGALDLFRRDRLRGSELRPGRDAGPGDRPGVDHLLAGGPSRECLQDAGPCSVRAVL